MTGACVPCLPKVRLLLRKELEVLSADGGNDAPLAEAPSRGGEEQRSVRRVARTQLAADESDRRGRRGGLDALRADGQRGEPALLVAVVRAHELVVVQRLLVRRLELDQFGASCLAEEVNDDLLLGDRSHRRAVAILKDEVRRVDLLGLVAPVADRYVQQGVAAGLQRHWSTHERQSVARLDLVVHSVRFELNDLRAQRHACRGKHGGPPNTQPDWPAPHDCPMIQKASRVFARVMKPLTGLPVDSFVQVSREADIPLKSLLELVQQVENGASPAFLARYRADLCAGLDEDRVQRVLRKLRDRRDLADRRISMLTTLDRRGALTPELRAQLEKAADRRELNDIFMPYRPRSRDAADEAIEKGLDPLARALWFQQEGVDIQAEVLKHSGPDGGAEDAERALEGAYAIAARWLSEKPEILRELRKLFQRDCELCVKSKTTGRTDSRARAMDGYRAKVSEVPWQKRLAIRRGVRTGQLETAVEMPLEAASRYLQRCLIKDPESEYALHLKRVVSAALRNGLPERVKKDVLLRVDEQTDREAIGSFRKALREALLAPPAHGVRIVGIETGRPGGWRAALIDGDGKLVDYAIVRKDDRGSARNRPASKSSRNGTPVPAKAPAPDTSSPQVTSAGSESTAPASGPVRGEAASTASDAGPPEAESPRRQKGRRTELSEFLRDRDVDLIVFPSGPRPHSTERFIRSHIRRCGKADIAWRVVRDSRTWIYATSRAAKREFGRLDTAFRSAITLARRIQDPLAELVKTDPKTLGIGANAHEVNAERLRETLRRTVECTAHDVGVDANRAPVALLSLVPGFSERLAKRVVEYRRRNGPFRRRDDLRKVDGLGDRIFAQAVGFLRVHGDEPLDSTGAHPEYRDLHERIAEASGCDVATLLAEPRRLDDLDPEQFASPDRSVLLVKAAIDEFKLERRQVRGDFEMPKPVVPLRSDEELKPGSKVGGVVASISDFGAWVDIGGDQDALLHVSQIHREFLAESKPSFKVGDSLEVYIRPKNDSNKRVSLTMWEPRARRQRGPRFPMRPGKPRPFEGRPGRGRRGGGRYDRRKPFSRTFGPASGPKGGRRRPRGKLSMAEKLDMLQDKYRTKV